ncbi:hypothetical protein [Mycobacterium sp. 050134]
MKANRKTKLLKAVALAATLFAVSLSAACIPRPASPGTVVAPSTQPANSQ